MWAVETVMLMDLSKDYQMKIVSVTSMAILMVKSMVTSTAAVLTHVARVSKLL